MKKIYALILSFVVLLVITSCKGGNRVGYTTIEYGRYPVEIVSSKEIIAQLNDLRIETKDKDGNVTNVSELRNQYGYFEIDGVEYERVIASPSGTEELYFSDNSPVREGKPFYFMVKPLKWRVLSTFDNAKVMICDNIIDVSNYLGDDSKHRYDESNLREFLNGKFLEQAFSKEAKKPIPTKIEVSNIYGEDKKEIEDMVWIPSYEEIMDTNNYKSDDDRYAFATDYAKAQGVEVFFDSPNSYYYNASPYPLRTVSTIRDNSIFYVDFYGKVTSVNNNSYYENVSVRPCITIEA